LITRRYFGRSAIVLMALVVGARAVRAKGSRDNILRDPSPIDHQQEPGSPSVLVFEEVRRSLDFKGVTPTDRAFFIGDWTYRFTSQDNSPAFAYQSFLANGAAPAKAVDGTWDQKENRWEFNDDRSFSLLYYTQAMPEYGVEKSTYSEERFHVLLKSRDEFVLFNEDGSVIIIYARARSASD
jgi:hypothetical protein